MSRLRRSLLSLVASLAAIGLFSVQGFAYVGQYIYDNTNPHNTTDNYGYLCDAYAYTPQLTGASYKIWVTGGGNSAGWLELRYSGSTHCATAWAKFTCENGGIFGTCFDYNLRIQRSNDGAIIDHWFTNGTDPGLYTYSNQLYDAGSLHSRACFSDGSIVQQCTSWW